MCFAAAGSIFSIPEPAWYEFFGVIDGPDAVSIYNSYRKPSGSNTVAQPFKSSGGTISEILLVFDTGVMFTDLRTSLLQKNNEQAR